ncbi:nucleotidyltransferase family protein [Rheinheimera sp. MMS21-TC3]|uniref:nucleotidyltransferase family protein n=1 Tax=Rheinheimera sp. MMS21-TC3 TaxID=3072790 RepID=UPI0028C481C3|nr:nucleotidyltransferase family protein [Rheinheimera sp. MMS21-TC3]WNO62191.1 nucleotidyltransferase family protein [Rheinheimera sp. MMS21-TC3]
MSFIVLDFFRDTQAFYQQAKPEHWRQLLVDLRRYGLLAKAYYQLHLHNPSLEPPAVVAKHLNAGAKYADKQQQSLFYELLLLEDLAAELDFPCLLLKGAAYRALALPMSYGRLFSDIDILVPEKSFLTMRSKLFFQGFYEPQISDYDRHYYMKWSHQSPPVQHFERHTVIDLHHQIYPTASALKLNIAPFFKRAVQISGSNLYLPCIEHLFIHAAVHLFFQEETHRTVKDIIDINQLFNHVMEQSGLASLQQEAKLIGAEAAVSNAAFVISKVFSNQEASAYLQQRNTLAPNKFVCKLMLKVLAAEPDKYSFAKQIWFVRGHFLKLKWYILLYHFAAKPINQLLLMFKKNKQPKVY